MSLTDHASFSATWSAASSEDDLRRFGAFVSEQGVPLSIDADTRALVERLTRSGSTRAAEVIEGRLSKLVSDAARAASDERRVFRLRAAPHGLYVLTPPQKTALEGEGHRFEDLSVSPLRQLATIPVTLGVYFGAQYALTAAGWSSDYAWMAALVAYVLTVRVVRGRWPLQPAR